MNNLDNFFNHYKDNLRKQIQENPQLYAWPPSNLDSFVEKMKIAAQRGEALFNSLAFRATCKTLGIKYNRKSIMDYINS